MSNYGGRGVQITQAMVKFLPDLRRPEQAYTSQLQDHASRLSIALHNTVSCVCSKQRAAVYLEWHQHPDPQSRRRARMETSGPRFHQGFSFHHIWPRTRPHKTVRRQETGRRWCMVRAGGEQAAWQGLDEKYNGYTIEASRRCHEKNVNTKTDSRPHYPHTCGGSKRQDDE